MKSNQQPFSLTQTKQMMDPSRHVGILTQAQTALSSNTMINKPYGIDNFNNNSIQLGQ